MRSARRAAARSAIAGTIASGMRMVVAEISAALVLLLATIVLRPEPAPASRRASGVQSGRRLPGARVDSAGVSIARRRGAFLRAVVGSARRRAGRRADRRHFGRAVERTARDRAVFGGRSIDSGTRPVRAPISARSRRAISPAVGTRLLHGRVFSETDRSRHAARRAGQRGARRSIPVRKRHRDNGS